MGCCETRDEVSKTPKEKVKTKKPGKLINFSQMQDQDFVVVPDRSPLSKQLNLNSNSGSLRLYIEWCRSLRKWNEIIEYIGDPTELSETQNYIAWAQDPQTISSLVITYLYLELKKSPESMIKHVESVIIEIIRRIDCSPDDFRDCSLFLLDEFLNHANEKVIISLVKFSVFEVLARILTKTDENLMNLLVDICVKIYKNRKFAQENFVDNSGVDCIISLLQNSEENSEDFIKKVLQGIVFLVKLDQEGVNTRVLQVLNDSNLLKTLKSLKKVKKIMKQDFQELFTILSNS